MSDEQSPASASSAAKPRDTLPAPVVVQLTTLPPVPCPYLPDRAETIRAVMASGIDPETYRAFMDAGFRRSGRMIYQPVCAGCRQCVQLRVPVNEFVPSRSQRRCWARNQDLAVSWSAPALTDEKSALYSRYVRDWHGRPEDAEESTLRTFLYDSPTQTLEFEYRDASHRLLGVGICDLSDTSLSSVYFYFDPSEHQRGLGTFGALYELAWCRAREIGHYYLGYWVRDCRAMDYKASFSPHELLSETGEWLPRLMRDADGPSRRSN
ncbi:MAG: arginyltransferase [Burkholderiales bacterium]|nr:arginyltransferase [Phycisphaerae bacterium]